LADCEEDGWVGPCGWPSQAEPGSNSGMRAGMIHPGYIVRQMKTITRVEL
jgi:hypothetical protein